MLLDVDFLRGELFSAFVRIVSDAGIVAILIVLSWFNLVPHFGCQKHGAFSCKPRIGQLD